MDTEHPSSRPHDASPRQARLALGLVIPVERFHEIEEPGQHGHSDERVPVTPPGFEQKYSHGGICRKSVSEQTARRPGTDDDEIGGFGHELPPA